MMNNPINSAIKKVKITITSFFLFMSTDAYSVDVAAQVLTTGSVKADSVNSATTITESALSNPMSSSYLIQLVLGLVVVILCVVALAWFAKKMNKFHSTTGDSLKIISGINMGTREKIILLQVGEEQILVGVSPGNINKLHTLNKPIIEADTNPVDKSFADKFKTIMADASASTKNKKNI